MFQVKRAATLCRVCVSTDSILCWVVSTTYYGSRFILVSISESNQPFMDLAHIVDLAYVKHFSVIIKEPIIESWVFATMTVVTVALVVKLQRKNKLCSCALCSRSPNLCSRDQSVFKAVLVMTIYLSFAVFIRVCSFLAWKWAQ